LSITIQNQDCIEGMLSLPDNSIDMILTDPPYGINFKSNWTKNHDAFPSINGRDISTVRNDTPVEWSDKLPQWLYQMARVLKPEGCCVCFCGGGGSKPVSVLFTVEFIRHFNLIQTVIWDKKTLGLGWRYRSCYETIVIGSKSTDYKWHTDSTMIGNIFRHTCIIPKKGQHPTQKPTNILRKFIMLHSQQGDTILDPFMGSGSTAIACIKENRKFIGFEIEPKNFEMTQKNIYYEQNKFDLFPEMKWNLSTSDSNEQL
jgi:site-specific DNA-methyltransferase (adenine-specific)